jgi:CelD/BcsL family acetyltransferase involved in cellulose biosynthesis
MSWSVVPAAEFAAHAGRWRALHATGPASPLLAVDFVEALLAVFGTGKEVLAWHGRGSDTDAMTILTPSRLGIWTTFQPSQAPVGLWLQRGAEPPGSLLRDLLRKLPGPGLMAGLTQCDPMLMARPADSATVRTIDYIRTARITVKGAGGFDAYWEARGKNLRNNLKKQRNRLRQDGIETQLEIVRAPHEMAQAVADYGRLEGSGWKAAGGTAVDAANEQGRFYRAMLEAFAARGAASVYRYRVGGQLAAMDLCVEGGGCIVVLKTAYDESMARHLSPALLMREEACRQLFEEARFERIEFYGRVMEWHLRWTDEVRTMYHLNGYRWPALARLHARARAGGDDIQPVSPAAA